MSDLFRKEAVTHATRRLNGEVVLATPVSFRLIAALAVAVVIGAVLFVATASYARKETVVGWLTPDAGMIRLSARQGGVVEAVHVREGDVVMVGQTVVPGAEAAECAWPVWPWSPVIMAMTPTL